MNDCLICYEARSGLIFLKCTHAMCSICLSKLQKPSCPFCRSDIVREDEEPVGRPLVEPLEGSLEGSVRGITRLQLYQERVPVIRIRVRRRRDRTTITETIDVDNRTIIIESIHRDNPKRLKKPRTGKNNSRKGRWAVTQHHNGHR
jgi:hypothetical protein